MPDEEKTGSITAGVESDIEGEFSAVVKLKLDEGLQLGEASEKFGQFNAFAGELEIKYPFGASPAQAKLSLNYLHWKLPELGPVLGELALHGAVQYAADNNWNTNHGFEAKLKTTHVKNLEATVVIDFKAEHKDNVTTLGMVSKVGFVYNF
jgi:hypothetical protein